MSHKPTVAALIATLFTALALTMMVLPDMALAQEDDGDENLIAYSDMVSGEITDDTPGIRYYFEGEANDLVAIAMRSGYCGNLDPTLALQTQTGVTIAEDDDGGSGGDALIYASLLPATGTYTIVATRSGGETGSTKGDYDLSLTRLEITDVELGTTVSDTLSPDGLPRLFQVELEEGEMVRVGATSSTEDLDPVLAVLDWSGIPIAEDDDSGGDNMPLLEPLVAPSEGLYTFAIFSAGYTGGPFEFFVDESTAVPLALDETIAMTLSEGQPSGTFLYHGKSGEVASFRLRRTAEAFQPNIAIYQGIPHWTTRIGRADGSRMTSLTLDVTLPSDALYVVVVSRLNSWADFTGSESFELTVSHTDFGN